MEREVDQDATFSGVLDFSMAIISNAVGLGNFWRFPFLTYQNGGGAFLVPYVIALVIMAEPLYYLELTLGQFTGRANIDLCRNITPAYEGIGVCQVYVSLCIMSYYAILVSLALLFFFYSFTTDLPWGHCESDWDDCIPAVGENINYTKSGNTSLTSSAELYFLKTILNEKPSIEDGLGTIQMKMVWVLMCTWISCLFLLLYGMQTLKKMSYFLALFPYVMLAFVFYRALTLEGAWTGVKWFLYPQWSLLMQPSVWMNAINQVFFSIGIGLGSANLYASYNDFNTDIRQVSIILAIVDTLTSLMCGIAIFATLGNLCVQTKVPIEKALKSGSSVAFITYPDALAKIPSVPWLISIMFFVMLFILGLGSLMAYHAVIARNIRDMIWADAKDWVLSCITAVIGFSIGLIYCTQGGQYIIDIVDTFGGGYVVFLIGFFQTICMVWGYGLQRFCWDVEFMSGKKVTCFQRWSWTVISPTVLIFAFIFNACMFKPLRRNGRDLPLSAQISGWMLFIICLTLIPIFAGIASYRWGCKKAFNSFENWKPKHVTYENEWIAFIKNKENELDAKQYTEWQKRLKALNGTS